MRNCESKKYATNGIVAEYQCHGARRVVRDVASAKSESVHTLTVSSPAYRTDSIDSVTSEGQDVKDVRTTASTVQDTGRLRTKTCVSLIRRSTLLVELGAILYQVTPLDMSYRTGTLLGSIDGGIALPVELSDQTVPVMARCTESNYSPHSSTSTSLRHETREC